MTNAQQTADTITTKTINMPPKTKTPAGAILQESLASLGGDGFMADSTARRTDITSSADSD